jgi:hypothetical protein
MRKVLIDREILAGEMRHAAQIGLPFSRVWDNLQRDYHIQNVDKVMLDQLKQNYNTLLFIVEERKNRYGNVG